MKFQLASLLLPRTMVTLETFGAFGFQVIFYFYA
jgi:hypothetical protein